MILLDTDVLSALMHAPADPNVVAWLDRQPRSSIWTTTVTVLEIRIGLATMTEGRRQKALLSAFATLLNETLHRRVAPFDLEAADQTAALMEARRARGKPQDLRDAMIAGIALVRKAALATHKTRHFDDAGLTLIDPWNPARRHP